MVAIKLSVPRRNQFTVDEHQKLSQEASVLKLFTSHRCEQAVGLVVISKPDDQWLCWFVMDYIEGENLEFDGCSAEELELNGCSSEVMSSENRFEVIFWLCGLHHNGQKHLGSFESDAF